LADEDTLQNSDAQKLLSWALTEKLEQGHDTSEPELPGFEVLGVLGRGGMGTVYRAKHYELGREVALKLFTAKGSDEELFVERLKREGRLMAQLEHPNVLGIYDADVLSDGTPYLVLEFVRGEDLQKRIYCEKKLSQKEALRIAMQVLRGLSAVHAVGVIHRDVKPANVLLGEDGSVKVTDFGVSKEAQEEQVSLTMTGTTIGTVDYMSPEQSNGGAVDERSDIYSVGVLLYEMIAGVTPRGAFEPLTKYGANKELNRIVMRCLQRDPTKRPASAASLAQQLRKFQNGTQRGKRGELAKLGYGLFAGLAALLVVGLFMAREVRKKESPQHAPDPRTSSAVVIDNPWNDLMEDFSLDEATLEGKWWRHSGTLICEQRASSLLQFPDKVGEKYVLEIEFTRVSPMGKMEVYLPFQANEFFVLGVSKRGVEVQGETRMIKLPFRNGLSYALRVELSGQLMRIFVNGERVYVRALETLEAKPLVDLPVQKPRRVAIGATDTELILSKCVWKSLD
jgi:serine/threonine protein kinase